MSNVGVVEFGDSGPVTGLNTVVPYETTQDILIGASVEFVIVQVQAAGSNGGGHGGLLATTAFGGSGGRAGAHAMVKILRKDIPQETVTITVGTVASPESSFGDLVIAEADGTLTINAGEIIFTAERSNQPSFWAQNGFGYGLGYDGHSSILGFGGGGAFSTGSNVDGADGTGHGSGGGGLAAVGDSNANVTGGLGTDGIVIVQTFGGLQ